MFSSTKFVSTENEDDRDWISINDFNQGKRFVENPDGGLFKKRVKFLNKSILDTTFLKIRTAGLKKSTKWTIRFFVGSPQERWLQIYVNDREPLADRFNEQNAYIGDFRKERNPLQRASARIFERESDDELSKFLRSSKTFKLSDAVEYTEGIYIAASSNRAAILTSRSQSMRVRFERLILLQALALAYRDVVDDLVFRQTKAILASTSSEQSVLDLEILRDEIVQFESALIFKTPLNDDSQHEVSAFWTECEQALGLNARIEELTSQNRSVYELLRARADGKAEKARQKIEDLDRYRDKKQSLRTALYGILIGVIGVVVTLVEPPFEWDQVLGFIGNFTKTLTSKF